MPILSKNISPVLLWLAILALCGAEFRQNQWEALLVMFAALELAPRALQLLDLPAQDWYALTPVGLCAAYLYPQFWYLAIPYLLYPAWLTIKHASEVFLPGNGKLADFVRVFALGYWATGALFALFYLADFRPFNFDPVIVSLTAAHFHVAGFVLTVVVYQLLKFQTDKVSRSLAWASLFGMPLVAAGITLSKLGYPTFIEQGAALGFAGFTLLIIVQQIRLSGQIKHSISGVWMLRFAVVCLLSGIVLAVCYALRFQLPIEWVSIPNMKIWHGTLNTLGFAWLSLLGYSRIQTGINA